MVQDTSQFDPPSPANLILHSSTNVHLLFPARLFNWWWWIHVIYSNPNPSQRLLTYLNCQPLHCPTPTHVITPTPPFFRSQPRSPCLTAGHSDLFSLKPTALTIWITPRALADLSQSSVCSRICRHPKRKWTACSVGVIEENFIKDNL